jgi:hypothetical protein
VTRGSLLDASLPPKQERYISSRSKRSGLRDGGSNRLPDQGVPRTAACAGRPKARAVLAEMSIMAFEDRCVEPRFKSRGCLQLLVGGATPLATTVYDNSTLGHMPGSGSAGGDRYDGSSGGRGFRRRRGGAVLPNDGGTYRIGIYLSRGSPTAPEADRGGRAQTGQPNRLPRLTPVRACR